jgi:hypothetical protein
MSEGVEREKVDFDEVARAALEGASRFELQVADLRTNEQATLLRLRSALGKPGERRAAITVLGVLSESFTRNLVPEIVAVALSHREALAARQLLGRLSYSAAAKSVPPAVWGQLENTGDYDAYRRMAQLLEHLGMADALRELCRRAAASNDSDVREVAVDFGGEN